MGGRVSARSQLGRIASFCITEIGDEYFLSYELDLVWNWASIPLRVCLGFCCIGIVIV